MVEIHRGKARIVFRALEACRCESQNIKASARSYHRNRRVHQNISKHAVPGQPGGCLSVLSRSWSLLSSRGQHEYGRGSDIKESDCQTFISVRQTFP